MKKLKRTGLYTSYFARYRGSHGVSIALYAPRGWKGEEYPDLFPSPQLLEDYKAGKVSKTQYAIRYYNETLKHLDPHKVYKDLEGKVLLCYEGLGFCHRHLVAKWLGQAGYKVTEKYIRGNKNDL